MSIAEGNRVYINITNRCTTECPFCCMHSSPAKRTHMDFEMFQRIILHERPTEVQLEGGEPLLHKRLLLFLEYLAERGVSRVIITTNGMLLQANLDMLTGFVRRTGTHLTIKMSINHHLAEIWNQKHAGLSAKMPSIFERAKDFHLATEFIPNFQMLFNVRLRHGDDWIVEKLQEHGLVEHSNIYELQAYGRYEGNPDYQEPEIVQNIERWRIYACDGQSFGQDLISRSQHESGLN